MSVSCIIHTRNSADTLDKALDSVAWADEIIVVDMESTDSTRAIAAKYTQRILSTPIVPRVDGIRQQFLAEARHDWILVLDSDEYLAADAQVNVTHLLEQYGDRYDAFAIPRFNYIAGQIMRGSGWYPAPQIRLFRKGTVRWPDANHQLPEVITGRLLELEPPDCLHIHHRNYEDLRHFIRKQLDYALNDRYDSDPSTFDFSSYTAKAYQNLATHQDTEHDGDLSHALATVMAWDAVMRGLIHWDSLSPKPPLAMLTGLPIAAGKVPPWRMRFKKWLGRRQSTRFVLHSVMYRMGWLSRVVRKTLSR